ncbi:MAG: NPCBM/NEW2 domain-containing protein, partial [Puniceicoccales bacterium]|nr:NPCBM/NEW2 domain-containing protein [Puniceicoccales bacterium]
MHKSLLLVSLAFLTNNLFSAETVSLGDLDVTPIQQGWGKPGKNRSVSGKELQIAGKSYSRGIGTHAPSTTIIELDQKAEKFSAMCGVDDATGDKASVRFQVYGDGKSLWQSAILRKGDVAVPVSLDVKGVRQLVLLVTDGGDGVDFDHANWADATVTYAGKPPAIVKPTVEEKVILTPPPSPQPRINSPAVFGVRPGSPFLY